MLKYHFPQDRVRTGKEEMIVFVHYISFWSARWSYFFSPFFAEQTIKYMLQFTFKCFKNIRETLEQDCGFNSLLSELLSFTSFHHRVSIHERFTAEQWQESRNKIRSKTVSSQ